MAPSNDSSVRTTVVPSRGSSHQEWIALMPSVLPVHAIRRGASTRLIVDVIVPGPAFQRDSVPSATAPRIDNDLTSGFQLGHRSNSVSTVQTSSAEAAISTSLAPAAGASTSIPAALANIIRSFIDVFPG